MKKWFGTILLVMSMLFFSAHALEERHLMVLCHDRGDSESQVNDIVELLITYGFDNRSIMGVYITPTKEGTQLADKLIKIGLFTKDKIHIDQRLLKPKSVLLDLYHEVEILYPRGHVIFMTTAKPAETLIKLLTQDDTHLKPAHGYLVPLYKRKEVV